MAIVPNLANIDAASSQLDNRLSSPTRSNAGSPVGSLTPAFAGEIVHDTTNRILYVAVGVSNNDWAPTSLTIK